MSKLQLFFDSELFAFTEIELPKYENDIPFKTKVTLREWFIKSKIEEMKNLYYLQISKHNYNYEIYLTL